jgi:hypothetical protein
MRSIEYIELFELPTILRAYSPYLSTDKVARLFACQYCHPYDIC